MGVLEILRGLHNIDLFYPDFEIKKSYKLLVYAREALFFDNDCEHDPSNYRS
jgi:hypothetical protein